MTPAALALAALATPALLPQELDASWFVDAAAGVDAAGRGATRQTAMRSIAYALDAAGREAASRPGARLRIALLQGTFTDVIDGTEQPFPLVLPGNAALLEIVSADGPGVVTIRPPHDGLNVLEYADDGANSGAVTFRFSGLRIEGGAFGLLARHIARDGVTLELESCEFRDQRARCVNVSSFQAAGVAVRISASTFSGSFGGVFLSAPPHGRLAFDITQSRFTHVRPYSPAGLLGGGIEINVEPGSRVEGAITRSYFTASASAVQITQPEVHPDPEISTQGQCGVTFANNVVAGLPPGEGDESLRMKIAFYLSLRPHHETELKVIHNTFVGLSRHVSYVDNWPELAIEQAGFVGFEFANNICRAVGAAGGSEFFEEELAERQPALGLTFPPPGMVIRSNLLERSAAVGWPGLNNFNADPEFANEAQGNFELGRASPARDRGDVASSQVSLVDHLGNCRRASPVCDLTTAPAPDLGAFEVAGYCGHEAPIPILRGDCNTDRGIDLADAVTSFAYLFLGGAEPACHDRCDVNDDGALNISDGVYTLLFLFNGGDPPLPPYPQTDVDPGRDCLPDCR